MPTQCQPWGCHSCLEPQGHEQYPALSLTLVVLFNGPKPSWLCSLRSFVHWQVGKGRVSLFSYYSFLLPLLCGFCLEQICTHSLDEDVRLLDGEKYFSGCVAQLPCAPAQKTCTCYQNLWELPWGFEMQHRVGWGGCTKGVSVRAAPAWEIHETEKEEIY